MTSIVDILKMNTSILQNDYSQNVCTICLGVIGDVNKATTECGHNFCLSCLLESLDKKNICPLCRKTLEPKRPERYKKITIESTNKYIEEIVNSYDISLVLYLLKNTQRNSYMNLVVHLRTIMIDLIRKLIVFQYTSASSDDDDDDDDDDDEEEDEEDEEDDDDDNDN
jgi:phosphopantothenoylcysteine synthetase/decarboxylase